MNAANYITTISCGQPDPRCPLCGRAVIGQFVQGNEGQYHPECTRPPVPAAPPPPQNPFPPTCLEAPTYLNRPFIDDDHVAINDIDWKLVDPWLRWC